MSILQSEKKVPCVFIFAKENCQDTHTADEMLLMFHIENYVHAFN